MTVTPRRVLPVIVAAQFAGTSMWFAGNAVVADIAHVVAGGLAVRLGVGDGPYRRRSGSFQPRAIVAAFKDTGFRSAALGYFGHMWELYAFWAFVPVALAFRLGAAEPGAEQTTVSILAFVVIAAGGLGCVLGGYRALRSGSAVVAVIALATTGVLCLAAPLVMRAPLPLFLVLLCVWGFAVVADSPQFSTLVARHASPEVRGSALTLVNCIGFAITIPSIQVLTALTGRFSPGWAFMVLAVGPALGLAAMRGIVRRAA